jgi:hypothetical protein
MPSELPAPDRQVRPAVPWQLLLTDAFCCLWALAASPRMLFSQPSACDPRPAQDLNQLSLEQLGNVELATVSKDPQTVQKTPAAVYVITQDDIQRSGATSKSPLVLIDGRSVPPVEHARILLQEGSISGDYRSRLSAMTALSRPNV